VKSLVSVLEHLLENILSLRERRSRHRSQSSHYVACLDGGEGSIFHRRPGRVVRPRRDQTPMLPEEPRLQKKFDSGGEVRDGKLRLLLKFSRGLLDEVESVRDERAQHLGSFSFSRHHLSRAAFSTCCASPTTPEPDPVLRSDQADE
jgi:hypothetical protein